MELKEYIVVCKEGGIPDVWNTETYQVVDRNNPKHFKGYRILATFNASDELKDSPYQGSAGAWVKASERLPEFVSRDKSYVVRYVMGNHPFEIWNWDMLNDREANGYVVEWLDSAASPAGDGWVSVEDGKSYKIKEEVVTGWARQQATAFAEFTTEKYWFDEDYRLWNLRDDLRPLLPDEQFRFTTEELYSLFLKQQAELPTPNKSV